MTALDLFQLLTPQEKAKLLGMVKQSPCERTGHKYKLIGRTYRWFRPPAEKLVCVQCGEVRYA